MGLFGHSSGGGAAARAAIDMKRSSAYSSNLRALAGLGIFVPATRLDVDELRGLRDIAVFQMAGQRDLAGRINPRGVNIMCVIHSQPIADKNLTRLVKNPSMQPHPSLHVWKKRK